MDLSLHPPHHRDIFLSPHPDDVCFSLGHLTSLRRQGSLVTVFPKTVYHSNPELLLQLDLHKITQLRRLEDVFFSSKCNLNLIHMDFFDAMARSEDFLDHRNIDLVIRLIEDGLIKFLLNKEDYVEKEKPTLFCPAGIGGHTDHMAIMLAVVKWLPLLRKDFHIVFYEDLHYAADKSMRDIGLSRLFMNLNNSKLDRQIIRLTKQDCSQKMALISLYDSQVRKGINNTIEAYSPASGDQFVHEALWILKTTLPKSQGN